MSGAMVRNGRLVVAATAVAAVLGLAPPAMAHQGHGSCAEGAQTFTVPTAQSGDMGETASTAGQSGTVADTSADLHEAGCEPRP